MKYLYSLLLLLFLNKIYAQQSNLSLVPFGSFMPDVGKYIVSGWVKEGQIEIPSNYVDSGINIAIANEFSAPIYSIVIKPSGGIIDGWQRLVGIIEIPDAITLLNAPIISIKLNCSSTQYDCYFDDIRFYPYNGNMKSFVYDEDTKRLMAELDENNYATFYEYDLEGGLVRVKKETERGVMTIQETRSSSKKQ